MAEKGGMFKDVMLVVKQLAKLCNIQSKTFEFGKPLKNTEVYNEGWLLRLAVAKLLDMKGEALVKLSDGKAFEAAATIGRCAARGWCSEGVLSPTFNGEGTTKADGIVGDIALRPDKKWGFTCTAGEFIFLEAKINSSLSSGVDHLSMLNQAARYVAIAARVMCENKNAAGRLIVLAPPQKVEAIGDVIKAAPQCLEEVLAKYGFHKNIVGISKEQFSKNVGQVVRASRCIAWTDLLATIPPGEDAKFMQEYYKRTMLANKN